ncbi:uncharacterized protein [Apostichopus japonicus]
MKTPSFYRILAILLTLVGIVHCQLPCPTVCSCYPDPVLNTGVIDCSNRGLTSIPDDLFYPPGGFIDKVDLSNNMLTTLDIDRVFTFLRGNRVEVLDFSSNLISDVTGTFDAAFGKDYVTLNLSSNAFTSFPNEVIPVTHERSQLILDFSNNRLTELTRHMFAGGNDATLFGFEFLARNNLINRIDDETFQGVATVDTILDLRSNLLTSLSPTFQSPAGVQELRFSGNPWNCDCNLRWIMDPMRFLVNQTSTDPPNCVTPVAIQGRPIFSLTSNEFTCLPFQQGPLQRNIVNQDSFTLSCPASADPPTPEISWTVWLPCPNGSDPLELFFTSDEITLSNIDTNPRAAFRCTAINNAGSVNFDLDIRVDGEKGIDIPVNIPSSSHKPIYTPSSGNTFFTTGHSPTPMYITGGIVVNETSLPIGLLCGLVVVIVLMIISWCVTGFTIHQNWNLKKKCSCTAQIKSSKNAPSDQYKPSVSGVEPASYYNIKKRQKNEMAGTPGHPLSLDLPQDEYEDTGHMPQSIKQLPVKPAVPPSNKAGVSSGTKPMVNDSAYYYITDQENAYLEPKN